MRRLYVADELGWGGSIAPIIASPIPRAAPKRTNETERVARLELKIFSEHTASIPAATCHQEMPSQLLTDITRGRPAASPTTGEGHAGSSPGRLRYTQAGTAHEPASRWRHGRHRTRPRALQVVPVHFLQCGSHAEFPQQCDYPSQLLRLIPLPETRKVLPCHTDTLRELGLGEPRRVAVMPNCRAV